MKKTVSILFIALIILVSCSNNEQKLIRNTWVIIEGEYKNQKINFIDNSQIIILEEYNDIYNYNPKLFFNENSEIRLPGINSKDIRGKWDLNNNFVTFKLDTLKYNYIHRKKDSSEISNKDFFGNELGMTIEEAFAKSVAFTNNNPIKTNEFQEQMKIYGNIFKIEFENDLLILKSEQTRIVAQRDKSVENMMNIFK